MRTKTQEMIKIALMTGLTVAMSFVKIPLGMVPFTLQTLSAMLAGVLLPKGKGAISQVLYIVMGLIGIPVFTAGGGFGYVLYPTFGYILFLPVLSLIVSLTYEKLKLFSFAIASLSLLLFGTVYYMLLSGAGMGVWKILLNFCIIFIPAELLKSIAAYLTAKSLVPQLKKLRMY